MQDLIEKFFKLERPVLSEIENVFNTRYNVETRTVKVPVFNGCQTIHVHDIYVHDVYIGYSTSAEIDNEYVSFVYEGQYEDHNEIY